MNVANLKFRGEIMNEDLLIIKLRDCFTAGYTLPQFCIDNNIKKPLFVAVDERRADFLWEIYVQFKYDKRITPKFILLNGRTPEFTFSVEAVLPELKFENPAEINFNDYDGIIVLNAIRLNNNFPKIIYLDQLKDYFMRRTYAEIPLLHFLQRHPKVKLIITNYPPQKKVDDPSFEKECLSLGELRQKLLENKNKHVPTLFDQFGYTNEEVLKLTATELIKTNFDGSTSIEDSGDFIIGTKNGKRITLNQPDDYLNTIYFVGNCVIYGINAPFDKTISSYLQKLLNENNLPYRVENASQTYFQRRQDMFFNLVKLNPKPNDIIFFFTHFVSSLPFINMRNAFDGYDYRKIWVTEGHPSEFGYKILGEKFFQLLVQNNFFKNVKFEYSPPPRRLIVTVSQKKISHQLQKISTAKIWTLINKNFVNTVSKSVA